MPVATQDVVATLSATLPPHFQQAQLSLANHRKNIVGLHKLQAACSKRTEKTLKGTKLVGEKAFNEIFLACVNRVLGIKKGVANADRIIKFVAAFAIYSQEQFRAAASKAAAEAGQEDEEEDTPATRFVAILLRHLLRGFGAKNKNVRLRACQCVALLINGLSEIEDDIYQNLRRSLLERVHDKESAVRVQAIVALAKLQGGDDDEEEEGGDGEDNVTAVLLDILRHDPSAEARRAALFNLTPSPTTLPLILERLRDVDPINRRCVYLGSLAMIQSSGMKLNVEDTKEVVRVGLGEREASVKRAAKKLVASWVDAAGGDLVKFLGRFDVVTSPVAESALHAVFEIRPELLDKVEFGDEFWQSLTPETAFLARIFVDHCNKNGDETRLDEALPLVTALAFRIQHEYNSLVDELSGAEDAEEQAKEQAKSSSKLDVAAHEFVVGELLGVAMSADYGDEIGRRKMFGLVREMISQPTLPETLIARCLDVLLKLSADQRDFMRIIVEIVQDLRDEEASDEEASEGEDGDGEEDEEVRQRRAANKKQAEPTEEEAVQQAVIDARRLIIVREMLERVVGALQENTALHGLIPQLIAPAVRSKDALVREQGLICLGLCCLLDKNLALDTLPLFIDQIQRGADAVKLRAVQVVFDLLITHGIPFLSSRGTNAEQITQFLLSLLEDDDTDVQANTAEGMAKLMLAGMIEDDEVLKSLVLVYMSPETGDNQVLRQCLSYFLPVYCFSSSLNQRRMQRVLVPVLEVLTQVYNDLDDDQDMVTPAQIGLQLIDWTDPEKGIHFEGRVRDDSIHVDVAIDLIKALFVNEDKDERKVMCQLLGKLYLPETLEEWKVKALFLIKGKLQEHRPLEDTVSRNAFARFETAVSKRYPDGGLSGIKVSDTPELAPIAEFLASLGIEDLDQAANENESKARPRRSSRKSAVVAAPATEEPEEAEPAAEGEDDDEEDEEVEEAADEEEEEEEASDDNE